jgi:16S rRNA (guanine527-N7)-methyltransferase
VDPGLEGKLRDGARSVGVSVEPPVVAALGRYLELLSLWNRRVNLSAVRDPEAIVEKHFVDSLAALPYLPDDAQTLVDVGSGAGFPGVVLALARPSLAVTLVESIHKKTAFLEALKRQLQIANLRIQTARAETLHPEADVAISRATWDVPEWLTRGAKLVHPGGMVLAMEGAELHELPPNATRHAYRLGSASRAIIVFHVEH